MASQHPRLGRYCGLLAAIVAAFAIEGIAEPGRWELALLTVLLGVTLMLALTVAETRPLFLRAAAALVITVSALSIAQALTGGLSERWVQIASALLVVLAPPAIALGVVRQIRETQSITIEAMIGGLCVYVLFGMFYSSLYNIVDRFGGAPFFAQQAPANFAHCLYFSFTTLATIGYGDLTARTNLGHTLSVSEGLLGQIYLVTVVSLIVGNLGRRRPQTRTLAQAPADSDRRS